MEALPAEILQDISWFALNPELYLVSKSFSPKLPPLHLFEEDVTSLLFCNRTAPNAGTDADAWVDFEPFPWRTSPAARYDHKLSREARMQLQQVILTQRWLSFSKFKRAAIRLGKLWVEKHWETAAMTTDDQRRLNDYLQEDVLYRRGMFREAHGYRRLICGHRRGFSVRDRSVSNYNLWETNRALGRPLLEVLAIPLKLFVPPRSPDKVGMFKIIRDFTWYREPAYPRSALREALLSATNKKWFTDLFYFAMRHEADIPRPQLIKEVYTIIIRERRWGLLKVLCEGIILPERFYEWRIKPDVEQAVEDPAAYGFRRWLEEEGWIDIKYRNYSGAYRVSNELEKSSLWLQPGQWPIWEEDV